MYLDSIKLAGFKSFVDPTTIKFTSNLTGIVGPNGCGKSNVVDAIRWVIGETSAKNLRAEAMADVIFNGTTNRKPVGQASIELNFDNTSGRIGGEYAEYSNIAVRRILQRDGQSTYYLNNTRCRRKDIIDIFLGTGLGPRSYSIIEQGMISKLIEAKPEDLRVFIEEAAGISKYKERRRETENRIKHTRENLERLMDLLEEITKQLSHLKRQANAAERYKSLKADQRLLKAQLLAMQWRDLSAQGKVLGEAVSELDLALEAKVTELRTVDNQLEQMRDQQHDASEQYTTVQERHYEVGTAIARLEQQINHAKERQVQIEEDLTQIAMNMEHLQTQSVDDEQQASEVTAELERLSSTSEEYRERATTAKDALSEAETQMQQWQREWDAFNQQAADSVRQVEVQQTNISHREQKIEQLVGRLQHLDEQLQQINFVELQSSIEDKGLQLSEYQERMSQAQTNVANVKQQIHDQRNENNELQHQLQQYQSELQQLHGRRTSLEALQQVALGKDNQAQQDWLAHHGLVDQPRVAEKIHVDQGWEKAVETVLGEHLEAICVDSFDQLELQLSQLENLNLGLMRADGSFESNTSMQGTTLSEKVQTELPIHQLIQHVYVTENIQQAWQLLPQLQPYQSVVTQDGMWLSSTWLRISHREDEKAGVIKRQQELESVEDSIDTLQKQVADQEQLLSDAKSKLQQLEESRERYEHDYREVNTLHSELRSDLSSKQTKLEHQQNRQEHLRSEREETETQLTQARELLSESKELWETAQSAVQDQLAQKEALQQRRDEIQQMLSASKEQSESQREQADEMQIRLESTRSQLHYLQQGIQRSKTQLAQLSERQQKQQQALVDINEPLPQYTEELESLLEQRLEVDRELTSAKQKLSEVEANIREYESSRHGLEDAAGEIRSKLEQSRMQQQTVTVKLETVNEGLDEIEQNVEQLLQELPETANMKEWDSELDAIESKIQRLGAINLAAIEEYDQQSERKEYLDQQHADLTEALETLENAIAKIDRETRSKFKETYEEVNKTFQEYFPKIFGGGRAEIELTGDDLLNTGLVVKAQPPGKRNTTIHLLSGGEKALTAIALVFSMFQLNPAPFCVLDEVDAPLDDANVMRFCQLVKAMSEKVQFIIISHNKVTIEMSNQLAGVTMHEPGCSRLVSVDMDEAIQMATA